MNSGASTSTTIASAPSGRPSHRAGTSTWFLLNKQAATAGVAAVVEDERESPLGPIRVTLTCEELDALTDWLVPDQR